MSLREMTEEQRKNVFPVFLESAYQGNLKSQRRVGEVFLKGLLAPQNYKASAFWLTQAAEQGDPEAQILLSTLYSNGWGVVINDAKAEEWLLKAAGQRSAKAQYKLGLHYEDCSYSRTDLTKALRWYDEAASRGHSQAKARAIGLRRLIDQQKLKKFTYGLPYKKKKNTISPDGLRTIKDLEVAIPTYSLDNLPAYIRRNRWDPKKAQVASMDYAVESILNMTSRTITTRDSSSVEILETIKASTWGETLEFIIVGANEFYTSAKCPRDGCDTFLENKKNRSKYCRARKMDYDRDGVGSEKIARVCLSHLKHQIRPPKYMPKPPEPDPPPPPPTVPLLQFQKPRRPRTDETLFATVKKKSRR
ncbi:hypothetical protein BGZ96_003800, partial [Linnemannia gamsii]